MNLTKIKDRAPLIITIIIILVFSIGLFKNINYIKFPNSDFFQYIDDGRQYLQFKLPHSIHPPPFAPIMICLVSKLFTNVEYPELFSAHLINIICATFTLLNIYLIFSKTKPWIGLFTVILVATNKIYITTSLNITNEVIFLFFLTSTLLAYSKKYYRLSYFLSGFSFFIRYEAIIVPTAIFINQYFKKKPKIKFFHLLLAFAPVIFWLLVLNFHSLGNSIFQNAYIDEIIAGANKIPNFDSTKSLLTLILSNPTNYFIKIVVPNKQIQLDQLVPYLNNIFSFIILFTCFKSIFSKKKDILTKIICSILPLFLVFNVLFPNFNIRYLLPLIWIVYFILLNRKNKLVLITLFIISLALNCFTLTKYSPYDTSFVKSEYKIISDWINHQKFSNQTIFFVYDPRLLSYFHNNKSVTLDFNSYQDTSNIFTECHNDIFCVVKSDNNYLTKDIFVVTQNTTTTNPDNIQDLYTEDIQHHISAFNDDKFYQNPNFELIKTLSPNQYSWVKIYRFLP